MEELKRVRREGISWVGREVEGGRRGMNVE